MFYLIANTQAGQSKYKSLAKKIERRAADLGLQVKIAPTDNLLEAGKLAKAAAKKSNVKAVVAVGGNKTVNTPSSAPWPAPASLWALSPLLAAVASPVPGIKNWQEGLKILKDHKIEEHAVGQINKNFFWARCASLPKNNWRPKPVKSRGVFWAVS